MTSTVSVTDQRLARIHQTGYWRVVVHPTEFLSRRIPSVDDCWRIVTEAQFNLRPIAYPHVDEQERQFGEDWVQSGGDWGSEIELWRFYQSGQFVQHLSIPEDRIAPWDETDNQKTGEIVKDARTLNIYDALFTITEILLFARGLAYRGVLQPSASLRIELHRTKGRRLIAPRSPWFRGDYMSEENVICWRNLTPSITILTTAPELALDATLHVFKQFGWHKPSRGMIEESQRRLLERRL